jgi:hypothetical protein
MVAPDILKQPHYNIGDLILIGGCVEESIPGRVSSARKDDATYIVDLDGAYIQLHESSIVGKVLTLSEKYDMLLAENEMLKRKCAYCSRS